LNTPEVSITDPVPDPEPTASEIVVVGGGIVGMAAAYRLARDGWKVVVLDPGDHRFGTSMRNAGQYVASHVHPMAEPGMVRSGLVSLLKRDGAFAVNPRYLKTAIPWLVEFTRYCKPANVERVAPALRWLANTSADALEELVEEQGSPDVCADGLLEVYYGRASLEKGLRRAGELGLNCEVRNPTRVLADSPRLLARPSGAVCYVDDRSLDPAEFWRVLRDAAEALGVAIFRDEVVGLEPSDSDVVVRAKDMTIKAGRVVLCAGAWSSQIAGRLGRHTRLRAAKGYSITLPGCSTGLSGPMLLFDPHLAVNPLDSGLRISSRFEITDPDDRRLDLRRTSAMLRLARRYLELDGPPEALSEWTGNRPAPTGGFPVIGAFPTARRIILCTGHGMIGTSVALGSAALVSAIVAERAVPPELAMLAPRS
jgi:D-amino-acid dehydrogenase